MPATRTPDVVDRDVHTLYKIAYALGRLSRSWVGGPRAAFRVRTATNRALAAKALADRILARPGVREHDETPYARQLLHSAMVRLTGPEAELLLLAGACSQAASSRPGVAVSDLLDLADWARALARRIGRDPKTAAIAEAHSELEMLRHRAVRSGLTTAEAAGTTTVDVVLPHGPHPRLTFSNAISTRGSTDVCFASWENATPAAETYWPYNNTRVTALTCTTDHRPTG